MSRPQLLLCYDFVHGVGGTLCSLTDHTGGFVRRA